MDTGVSKQLRAFLLVHNFGTAPARKQGTISATGDSIDASLHLLVHT